METKTTFADLPLIETKAFDSNGVSISYTKTYSSNKSEKSIIFVHGYSQSGGIFAEIARRLSSDYTVYCPDSRSHGKSGKVKRLKFADMADDIANLIAHESIEKPVFFGFSDGGNIGMLLAIKHPEILAKLCVAGINLTPKGIKKSLRRLMRLGFFFTRSDKLRLMMTQPNITADDLKKILVPTTVYYADKEIVDIADSQAVVENATNAKLVIVPNEDHGSYIMDNAKLYELLKKEL
jgi:pimeloyl-ACP methyl ester carboxylesterase